MPLYNAIIMVFFRTSGNSHSAKECWNILHSGLIVTLHMALSSSYETTSGPLLVFKVLHRAVAAIKGEQLCGWY